MIDHVVSEVADGIQTVRFDRIEARNALTAAMCEAAADAISFGESSSRVRAIVITGSPGIFVTGHDPSELAGFADEGAIGESVVRLLKTLATVDKPIIAAVDGPVFGFGTTILFLCDYVVASEWSSFAAPFVDMGLPPDAASSLLAPRLIGYSRAFALIVLGESFDARQAREAGFVNRVVAAEEVESVAREIAAAVAAKPPEAVRMARRMMRGDRREVLTRIDQEAAGFVELLKSPAARDALQAFLDRGR
ncbi:MAG: enoyl-CoA hydratase-related protein [Bauldia sp.]|nr:enoyl-CoA hydratase-related protein [Bauldia sp.]